MINMIYNICFTVYNLAVWFFIIGLFVPKIGDWYVRFYNHARVIKPIDDRDKLEGLADV